MSLFAGDYILSSQDQPEALLRSVAASQLRVERGLAELVAAYNRSEQRTGAGGSNQSSAGIASPQLVATLSLSRKPPSCFLPAARGTGSTQGSLLASELSLSPIIGGSLPPIHAAEESAEGSDSRLGGGSLPDGWPRSLESRFSASDVQRIRPDAKQKWSLSVDGDDQEVRQPVTWTSMLRDPSSTPHVTFALLGLFFLCHDLTIIPFALSWQLHFEGYLQVSTLISVVFWTCDIAVNFVKGYYSGGDLVSEPKLVVRRYLRTWFLPDFLMVSCDWCGVIIEMFLTDRKGTSASSLKMLRFTRLGRLLRIAGICRMLRVYQALRDVLDDLLSDDIRFGLSTLWLAGGALWATHMIACCWFAIGRFGFSDTGLRWVTAFNDRLRLNSSLDTSSMQGHIYQYLSAYHWSLAQVSLGSMEVICTNTSERVFNILCNILGLFGGSALISLLSANMLAFQSRQRDKNERLRVLRRYLQENTVAPTLAVRVLRQATERMQSKKMLTEDAVLALGMISTFLRGELHLSICRPHIQSHPFLMLVSNMHQVWLNNLTLNAVNMVYLNKADLLFSSGDEGRAMYKVLAGELQYMQLPGLAPPEEESTRALDHQSDWIAEPSLWCRWVHVGTMEGLSPACKLMEISVDEFIERSRSMVVVVEYGRQFHKRVIAARPPHSSYPSDLGVPFTELCELVHSMSRQVSSAIGAHFLKFLPGSRRRSRIEKLAEEVNNGDCTMILDRMQKPLRIISLVALCVEDDQGLVLVKLGKFVDGEPLADVALPGQKRRRGEASDAALERLMLEKVRFLQGCIELGGMKPEPIEKMSKEYHVNTRYFRTVCYARYVRPFEIPRCGWSTLSSASFDKFERQQRVSKLSTEPGAVGNLLTPDWMQEQPVYFAGDSEDSGSFYTWLKPDTFDFLKSPHGQAILPLWLACLRIPGPSSERCPTSPEQDVLPVTSVPFMPAESSMMDLGESDGGHSV